MRSSALSSAEATAMDSGLPTMKLLKLHWLVATGIVILGLSLGGCSRLLPARKGTAHSFQLVLDTRRLPAEALTGCFIPAIFPAVTKLPIVYAQKVPANAT